MNREIRAGLRKLQNMQKLLQQWADATSRRDAGDLAGACHLLEDLISQATRELRLDEAKLAYVLLDLALVYSAQNKLARAARIRARVYRLKARQALKDAHRYDKLRVYEECLADKFRRKR